MDRTTTKPRITWPAVDREAYLTETLSALMGALVFSLAAEHVAQAGAAGVRDILTALLTFSSLWSLFSALMFLLRKLDCRGRVARFVHAYHVHPDEEEALDAIGHELEPTLASLADDRMRARINWHVLSKIALAVPVPARLRLSDLGGAAGLFISVFMITIPASLPFLIGSSPWLAMRCSNLIVIGLLSVVGRRWADRTGLLRPWLAGPVFAALGAGIVWAALQFP